MKAESISKQYILVFNIFHNNSPLSKLCNNVKGHQECKSQIKDKHRNEEFDTDINCGFFTCK